MMHSSLLGSRFTRHSESIHSNFSFNRWSITSGNFSVSSREIVISSLPFFMVTWSYSCSNNSSSRICILRAKVTQLVSIASLTSVGVNKFFNISHVSRVRGLPIEED